MKKLRIIGLLCLLYCPTLRAQDYANYKFRHISPKSGLSSIYARKVIQDPYGFLWIGTEDGLDRYDGKNFVIYNKGLDERHLLAGADIQGLVLDTADRLIWVISSYGGIDAIDYRTGIPVYHYFQDRDRSMAGIWFTSFVLLDRRLYIGSQKRLFVLDTREKILRVADMGASLRKDSAELFIDNLIADHAGRIWLFCRGRGALLLRNRNDSALELVDEQRIDAGGTVIRYFDGALLNDGRVLSASNEGLRLFSTDRNGAIHADNDPYPAIRFAKGRTIYSCRQDRAGNIWFCTPNYLVKMTAGGDRFFLIRENFTRDEFNWIRAAYYIYFDREDNLWLGCQQGLAYAQNRPSGFTCVRRSAQSDATIQQAYYIYPLNDSVLYCCAQEGLYKIHPATGDIRPVDTGRAFYHVFMDPHNRLIASNLDGVYFIDGDRFIPLEKIYPEFRPLKKLFFNSHCYIGDSVIIFGTENDRGIVAWNYKRGRAQIIDRHTPLLWLKENTVNTVYKDRMGKVWVLGDNSVSILDFTDHSVQTLNTYSTTLKKNYSIFFDICEARGCYYLACYGTGVLVLDQQHELIGELSLKDGLAGNGVYKILDWRDSLLFVTSNNGLSVIDIQGHNHIKNYYESDGLHSDNFEENSGAARNNIVYVGGTGGLTIIDPSFLPTPSSPPKLYVRQVKIETQSGLIDTSNLLMTNLEIPNNSLQTTIYFSSINYPNPERSLFVYKIKELNEKWIPIGSQDFVNLIGLNPGRYTLQVRSANEDGLWNEHPLELTLIFIPKWYQTLWFRLLIIAVISALLYSVYRYRIDQIQQQQQIRKNIASDLHDDIGSILNTVKIFTHLAKKDRQKEDHLTHIEESLAQATMGLRDMIWVLDDSRDTIRELLDRIKKFALPVVTANDIRFECQAPEGLDEESISKTEKRNLLLIAKETINNSIKYAECRNIWVSIGQENKKLCLSIRDDGKGFDGGCVASGNGLKNIVQRARQIHFEARIVSSPGSGTLVLVQEV